MARETGKEMGREDGSGSERGNVGVALRLYM